MLDGVICRNYSGPEDLGVMQELAQSIWSRASRFHIGDLAWARFQHAGREAEWATRLWERNGAVVAWGWRQSGASLDVMVHPNLPFLSGRVLEWFEANAGPGDLTATVLDAENHLVDGLIRRGYVPQPGGPFDLHCASELGALPDVSLPEGYSAHHVRGESDIAQGVEVHRAAWSAALLPNPSPSRFTIESYRNVTKAWPYRKTSTG